jgi:AmmeMemoRadiSam system protein A/AmmeMemoRadiSam system protein B
MAVTGGIMVPHPPLIIPEVGRGRESCIQETIDACTQAGAFVRALAPETVVIVSPHSIMYSDYINISPGESASGSFRDFGAGGVGFHERYDREFADLLAARAEKAGIPAGTSGEQKKELDHGTMIPLWFIRRAPADFRIVRIGISGLPLSVHYRLGIEIQKTAEALGRRVVFVASGDLSHKLKKEGPYGFDPDGPVYDRKIMEVMGSGEFDRLLDFDEVFCEKAAECGHRSFVMMAGALDGKALEIRTLSHQDVTGVGYGVCTFRVTGEDTGRHFLAEWYNRRRAALDSKKAAEDPYVKLARASIETYIRTGKRLRIPKGLPANLTDRRAGVFVSLRLEGQLRGCIGTIRPVCGSVAEEIVQNAVSAAVHDPRFRPVSEGELDRLEYSVDVLGPTEPVHSPEELDVKRYGIVVSSGGRRGLLLPNLDGVDTVRQQIAIARQKAGIAPYEDVELERFEVVRHV